MKAISPILLSAGIFLATALLSQADTVTMKSGEVYNGKVLSETDTQITMDVLYSAGITDQKVLSKAEVQSVSKTAADEIAYNAIKGIQPGANSLQTAVAYDASIKALESFIATYPEGSRVKDARATLDTFKEEQARVKAGDIKYNNRWFTAKEAEKNKYQINAQKEFQSMKELAVRKDFIDALNMFAEIEKTYPGAAIFPDAVELAQSMVRIAPAESERLKAAVAAQEAQFNNSIQLIAEPEKSLTINARKAQLANAEAKFAATEKSGLKWRPFLPTVAKSYDALKSSLSSEGTRIEKISVAEMRKSLAATDAAEDAMKAKNFALTDAKLKEAKTLWAQNERVAALAAEMVVLKATASGARINPDGTAASPTATPSATPKAKKGFLDSILH